MKKKADKWLIKDLENKFGLINFPEYQREPTVWSRVAKQRLIDSILRHFDISALYFYRKDDDSLDCVDGRQRIGAIMSFLGRNDLDKHNGFEFRVLNEIYTDRRHPFCSMDGMKFQEIKDRSCQDPQAKQFVDTFNQYDVTTVILSESYEELEFNLQFTRLNLGTIINSGEKLHAMVGDLRDECFGNLGGHKFLTSVNIPTRRYAREQLAAQIIAQVFSIEKSKGNEKQYYARTRHFDLQLLFKRHVELMPEEWRWIKKVRRVMGRLNEAFDDTGVLRSRAMVVSTVLLAYKNQDKSLFKARKFAKFITEFMHRLREEVAKGLDFDPKFRFLIQFQRHLSQASVEKRAVRERAKELEDRFEIWQNLGMLTRED